MLGIRETFERERSEAIESKKVFLGGILCLFFVCGQLRVVHAESVFAVASHSNSKVKAYLINGDKIDRQATIKDTESFADGATGFCVWHEKQRMFVTYEGSPVIAWASTKTLSRDPDTDEFDTDIPNADLAGMVVDEGDSVLYVLTRSGGHLYTYTYDENENTLYLVHPNDPCYPEREYRQLEGINGSAYDLALDEEKGLCYVSNGSRTVRYYDTTDWAFEGSIDMGLNVAGIGIDPNNYLYGGYFNGTTGYHNYLLRYNLNGDPCDPETVIKKDMGYIIMDIAVGAGGGLIYTTTDNTEPNFLGTVEVYDASNWVSSNPDSLILTDTEYDTDFTGSKPGGIAVGPRYKPPAIGVSKVDDVNDDPNFVTCILPDDEITYTIIIDPCGIDHEWVTVIDYLPKGVAFGGSDPNYDPQEHSYTWQLGGLSATDDSVVLEITVTVTEGAEPAGQLVNAVSAESDFAYTYNETSEETPVCCWIEGDIIYVDDTANGYNTGVSWANAYADLQDALARAAKGCGTQIWVAAGIYSPGDDPTNTFTIPDGVVLYGGLAGNEPNTYNPNDRTMIQYKSLLTGNEVNNKVVTMGQTTKLHGFVVEKAYRHSFYSISSDFTAERCVIKDNKERGIECSYGNLTVNWCVIKNNIDDGIYSDGYGKTLEVNNCKIYDNGENGIYTYSSTAFVRNSEINHNGWDKVNNYDNGIKLQSPSATGAVCNCTVFRNEGHGVYFSGTSANKPDIRNCIFYNNNYHDDLTQFYGGLTAHYCSVTDPADPNSTDCTKYGDNNMKCDPRFAYININDHNLHLAADSPCIDAGDETVVGPTEVDIDADSRIDDTDVDMGADEVSCTDEISNSLDWNGDGLVNNNEYGRFAKAWLQYDPDEYTGDDPNDTVNWDPRCNLDNTGDSQYVIDLADVVVFAESWCWQACWKDLEKGFSMMAMGSGSGMMSMESVSSEILTAPQPEPTIEEQIEQTEQILDWLNDLWKTDEAVRDTIDKDQWKDFIDRIEAWLDELEEEL
ncbi:MAG: hypothetical protein DRP65_10995 [Planctomycetota bacterium]|nr:MAG: hypothetical protein DRP65_10995 [Planctomycetota bacterium]